MIINKLILKNFQLFKEAEINFGKTNLITGINLDSQELDSSYSGNGAGKSSIINSIIFCLFGEVTNLTLKDLIRIDEKECSVEIDCSLNGEQYRIIRKIPSELQLFSSKGEHKFNTQTLLQKYINDLIGEDLNKFRIYRMIDQSKGINLLDLGIVSLRKNLMDLVSNQFIGIRNNLLAKKLERERFSVDKKLYHFYLSTKRQTILNNGLLRLQEEESTILKDKKEQESIINNLIGEIKGKEKEIYYRQNEIKKAKDGICPILRTKCEKISQSLNEKDNEKNLEVSQEMEQLNYKIEQIKFKLKEEESCLKYYNELYEDIQNHVRKVKEYLMKIKEAQKFSEYKYNRADIQLYADSTKTLDSFSAYYVMEWLNNLSLILNNLLKSINISIEFSIDKDFIKVNNAGQELNYSQLSSGQKTFLNTVFKLGILMNEGIHDGLIIIDEGINTCDQISFQKLLEIINNLNFQSIIVYQNVNKEIEDVNYINVDRKNGESKVNG
jgi:DNA repair exonuclease SbcCD ATPase subunit